MTHLRVPIYLPLICLAVGAVLAAQPVSGSRPRPLAVPTPASIRSTDPLPLTDTLRGVRQIVLRGDSLDTSDGTRPVPLARIVGAGSGAQVIVDSLIDFGAVPVGAHRDTTVLAVNDEAVPIAFNRVYVAGAADTEFSIIGLVLPSGAGNFLPPDSSAQIQLRFTCDGPGEHNDSAIVVTDNGLKKSTILLRGSAIVPVLKIDSTTIAPGEIATIHAWVEGTGTIQISAFTVELEINPKALVLQQVIPEFDSTRISWELRDGRWIISGTTSGPPIPDGRLFRLGLLGLSTGQPENDVTAAAAAATELGQLKAPVTGVVSLVGCDVGLALTPVGRLVISGCSATQGGSAVSVAYTAPTGSAPHARLYDMMGHLVVDRQAPPLMTTGGAIEIPITSLPRGMYLLDMEDLGAHTSTLIPVPITGH